MAPKRRKASAGSRGASEERPEKARPVKRGSFNKPGGLDGCFQESHIQRTEQMKSACKYTDTSTFKGAPNGS